DGVDTGGVRRVDDEIGPEAGGNVAPAAVADKGILDQREGRGDVEDHVVGGALADGGSVGVDRSGAGGEGVDLEFAEEAGHVGVERQVAKLRVIGDLADEVGNGIGRGR